MMVYMNIKITRKSGRNNFEKRMTENLVLKFSRVNDEGGRSTL